MYGLPAVPPVFWRLLSWASTAPRDRAPLHAASVLIFRIRALAGGGATLDAPPNRPYVTPMLPLYLALFDSACCPILPLLL